METLLGLLPLMLVILLVWGAVSYSRRQQGLEVAGPNGERPYGVRGWLAVFVYCTMGLAPIVSISRVNQSLVDAETKYPALLSLDGWGSYKAATWVAVAVVCAWQIFVALRLRNHFVPKSVAHARVLLVAAPLVYWVADAVAGKAYLDVDVTAEGVGGIVASWIAAAVWLGYLYKSQRVRNTYGLDSKRAQPRLSRPNSKSIESTDALIREVHLSQAPSAESRLQELKGLLERGLISEADYQAKKQEILINL